MAKYQRSGGRRARLAGLIVSIAAASLFVAAPASAADPRDDDGRAVDRTLDGAFGQADDGTVQSLGVEWTFAPDTDANGSEPGTSNRRKGEGRGQRQISPMLGVEWT